jgi:hypothetical protein
MVAIATIDLTNGYTILYIEDAGASFTKIPLIVSFRRSRNGKSFLPLQQFRSESPTCMLKFNNFFQSLL